MNNTILIGTNNNFSIKTNRWLFPITGLIFLTTGGARLIYDFNASNDAVIGLIIGILMSVMGLYYFIYGLTAFSTNSRLALRIKITDEFIEIKDRFLKPPIHLIWTDLKSIEFGKYKIVFQLEESNKVFSYKSNANVSVEIKKMIREMADEKKIEVVAG